MMNHSCHSPSKATRQLPTSGKDIRSGTKQAWEAGAQCPEVALLSLEDNLRAVWALRRLSVQPWPLALMPPAQPWAQDSSTCVEV